MKPDEQPPPTVDLFEAVLYVLVGSILTYFFFEPGKEAISALVKAALPSGW